MTRHVEALMIPGVNALDEGATFKDVARRLADACVTAMPVVGEDGRVIGVVSEADLILRDESFGVPWLPDGWMKRAVRRKAHARTAGELMTTPAITVGPDADVTEAAAIMRKHGIKRLPVCDVDGHLLGMVSRTELLREFLREDTDLSFDIAELLWHQMSIPKYEVWFTVEDGVVTVEGHIEHRVQAAEAVERIREIPGTVEVVDRLRWTHDDSVIAQGPIPWVGF